MLDREQLAGAVEAHLDLVHDQQDAVLVEHALQLGEEVLRRDDVAAGALDRLDVEGGKLGLAGLGVPHAVVFALEQALELLDAVVAVFLLAHPLGAAEMVGERHELGPVAEVAVAPAIAVGRGDRGGAERAAVIAALEGEHQALAVLGVAHELQAVLDRLAAADIEVDAALQPELLLGRLGQHGGELDLLAVQVLARHLRQPVELAPRGIVEALVAIAEIDGRVPHLQIEVGAALRVVEERALAARRRSSADWCSARCRRASSTRPRAPAAPLPTARPLASSTLAAGPAAASRARACRLALLPSVFRSLRRLAEVGGDAAFEPARQNLGRLGEIGKREVG